MSSNHETHIIPNSPDNFNEEIHEIQTSSSKRVYIFMCLSVLIIFLELLVKRYLDDFSMYLQQNLNGTFSCSALEKMMFFEYNGKILFYIILFQFSNIYSCFLFWFTSNSVPFIMTILKLIFADDRPFWINSSLTPCLCATNFGNPSTSTFNILALALIVLKAPLNKNYSFVNSHFFKWSIMVGAILWNLIVASIRFLQNAHSLNQLLFGAACGVWIYYLYFKILGFNPSSKTQFMFLVKNGLRFFAVCVSLLLICLMIIYVYPIRNLTLQVETRLEETCPNSFSYLELDSYVKAPAIMTNAIMILMLWIEYKFIFQSDQQQFLADNFDENTRFNSQLPIWNIFTKLAIYLAIMIYVIDGVIVVKRSERLNILYWFEGPFIVSIIVGVLHILGIKYIFKLLRLNSSINGSSKKIANLMNISTDDESFKNEVEDEEKTISLLSNHI